MQFSQSMAVTPYVLSFSRSSPCLALWFQVLCTLIAAFLHFFFLSSFCWVLTEAWQSYMAVTGRLRNRIIRKRFLCLGWGGPSDCCLLCPLSGPTFPILIFYFPDRSPRTGRGNLSGIHQGKRLWNPELVSMLISPFKYLCRNIMAGELCVQRN